MVDVLYKQLIDRQYLCLLVDNTSDSKTVLISKVEK